MKITITTKKHTFTSSRNKNRQLMLVEVGERVIACIKEIRVYTHMTLRDAKFLVDLVRSGHGSQPVFVTEDQALMNRAVLAFEFIGATVEVRKVR